MAFSPCRTGLAKIKRYIIDTPAIPGGPPRPPMNKAKTVLKWSLIVLLILLVVSTLGIVAYTQIATAAPEAVAEEALLSTTEVLVESADWLVFRPAGSTPATGLIFYPGALVDPRAYAPFAQEIAAAGYLVVIPPMPLNLAVLNPNEGEKIMETFPEIEHWALGGHSLGGVMATQFVKNFPWAAEGLALWGAYPAGGDDVSCRILDAVSIYGTQDGLSTPEEILASQLLLPPDTIYVPIEGGNHAQFGWYGNQRGDLPAGITHLEQQAQTVAATIKMLERIEAGKSEDKQGKG